MAAKKFHNPYNFVPFGSVVTDGLLDQRKPPGHRAYKTGLFEGSIEIELEAVSPLLLFDPAKTTVKQQNEHKTLDLLTTPDGKPILRPTSLKGALRAAYEAITCSRLGVLDERYKTPLVRRKKPAKKSPYGDLLDKEFLPADDEAKFSSADRVFGWVRQEKDEETSSTNAYKGHLRIRKVQCLTEAEKAIQRFYESNQEDSLPLSILSSPKPQQALFYASGDASGAFTYDQANKLLGRKFYLHHSGVPDGYWDADKAMADAKNTCGPQQTNGTYREYIRWKEQRDTQNVSIRAWVKPKTKFKAEIRFDNLNTAEVGALLWLCSLNKKYHLKVGAGKPLGFGSVTTELVKVEIRNHDVLQKEYGDLIPQNSTSKVGESAITCVSDAKHYFIQPFKKALCEDPKNFKDHAAIKAFLAIAQGPCDPPVHYPRQSPKPDPKGENFKWFGDNKQPLPPPGESGLPYCSGQ